jgi:hypothetical protein
MGALEDGYKSILRYLKNNYFDGARQVRVQTTLQFSSYNNHVGRF